MIKPHTYANTIATEVVKAHRRIAEINRSIDAFWWDFEVCEGLYREWSDLESQLADLAAAHRDMWITISAPDCTGEPK